ncbi:MAG TPA: EscU/YscU/HrcU family type III secretion system export apparatus switch protein [Solirubrobacterales bacterium]|jgi:flagellar biosynthetic protein FlhB|nr:EscU/YscU/HrcU family type III secretion system export apparatus switch protein [Solirubrobacterales bacterium]
MPAGEDRTEKATPKRRKDARKKGQVAKSTDLNGAIVLVAALGSLAVFGPHIAGDLGNTMRGMLGDAGHPGKAAGGPGLSSLAGTAGMAILMAVAPVALACFLAALVANVAQVGFRPSAAGLKPDFKRLNPIQGAKNLLGPNTLVETLKSIAKVTAVGLIAAMALLPNMAKLAAMTGLEPPAFGAAISSLASGIAWKAAAAYLLIGALDLIWQRHRVNKGMKMTKEEVKREQKDEAVSPELRASLRRRAQQISRGRMMSAVLGADVVVANPTHFAVALAYDGKRPAPIVVAKGQDLIALEIRRVAEEAGVPVVEDKPLARSLFDAVPLEAEIPADFYRAIAELLAYVYRTARKRSPLARAA